MNEYKYIGKEMVLDVIKARGRYLGDAEIMNSMDKTALDQIAGYKRALDSIAEDVENIPPVNVQPVKRGKWENEYLEDDVWWADCTNCKNDTHSRFGRVSSYTFCPNCGADMRGDTDDKP